LLLASLPLLVLIILYFLTDPFKVIYSYPSYYKNNVIEIPLNRDYISTELFLKKYKYYNYNSFAFGSSRSLAFMCKDINKYQKGNYFHFDANGETLFGVLEKLRFLKKLNVKIDNCIIILDSALVLQTKNSEGHTYIKHPLISNESSCTFQYTFLTTFLSNKFFIPFIFSKVNLKIPKSLEYPDIFDLRTFEYDSVNNDIIFASAEKEIADTKESYYKKYQISAERPNNGIKRYYDRLINEEQLKDFMEIKSIIDKNKANIILIVYPDYNQVYFNLNDIENLQKLFGSKNIFDYSGVNKYTNDLTNYYDLLHIRSFVGDEILQQIFNEMKTGGS